MFFSRPDGTRIKKLPGLRAMMPYVMRNRNESCVYFEQTLILDELEKFLQEQEGCKLFHVLLAAYVRVLGERKRLNRFVSGYQLYQRKQIQISFAVKKQFADNAKMTTVKVTFEADDTLDDIRRKVNDSVSVGKGEKKTTSEKEVALITKLPRFLIRALMAGQRWLDYWNLLPNSMIAPDPMYASLFVANLGSIGLDSAYHHLYEYGNIPLFATIGKTKVAPHFQEDGSFQVKKQLIIRYTLDERIADGFYCVQSLQLFKQFVENPASLL